MENYFILDIETCPIDAASAQLLPDEERKKHLNPIDSRIVAIGIRSRGRNLIFLSDDEKPMLEMFWTEWKNLKKVNPEMPIIGFNILSFDIPFLVTRSFINDVAIAPFTLKDIIDLREKINAHRQGHSRGTLKELAGATGITLSGIDGSNMLEFCLKKDWKAVKSYLEKDLEMTESLYERAKKLNITKIMRW